MPNLVIVESPTKARTLSRFLGKEYQIEATMGHVRDLPENKLGIEVKVKRKEKLGEREPITHNLQLTTQYEFIPDYQIIAGRKPRVAELKKLAGTSSNVILATDPDREGEAIAFHVAELLKSKSKTPNPKSQTNPKSKIQNQDFKRIVFHEITESAIAEALAHPRTIDMQLVDAQQARRLLDRLVGYKLSPLLWNKLGKRWLSAGRVQSVAVRLVVEREREILAFKPEEYWVIEAELQKSQIPNPKSQINPNDQNSNFIARLIKIGEKKAEIKNKETADRVVEDLKGASYSVAHIETKEVKRFPSPPFTTSTLQQTAANRFGWSAKRTMRTAQGLYEEGYITYHRTDSTNLAHEAITMVRGYIDSVYGKAYLPDAPKLYKIKSKVAQEAHEAIRPTDVSLARSHLARLGRDAELLYSLIRKRFVACQMREAVFDATSVTIEAKNDILSSADGQNVYVLRVAGQTMKFAGWLSVYGNEKDEDKKEDENRELPALTIGESVKYIRVISSQKCTEPPPRYNEASLIKTLEEKGIGRPSTYAPIISTIQDRKYVEKRERRFYPTDLGVAVVDFLVKYFPDVFDISFTARMEDELDEVANGALSWEGVIGEFYDPLMTRLESAFKTAERIKLDLGTTDEKCPECGSSLTIRMSKFGKFLACTNFPTCKFTKNLMEKAGILCPKCGGDIILKKTRSGKQFYGCSNYPTCIFAAWKKEDIK